MPELPEVEHAVKLLVEVGAGKRICKVDAIEDNIVFTQTNREQFAAEITGRVIQNVHRHGKVFYLELGGEGKVPVLHFGMTGKLQVKGQEPMHYQMGSKDSTTTWPPRYMKFVMYLASDPPDIVTEVAFVDMRRLGRIRLCTSPMTEPPISELGFDPILSMPALDKFVPMVRRRTCPIKALLLDQSFSAGVGNWVADEILFNARIHPEQRCNTLTDGQVQSLHHYVVNVCETAVAVDADSQRFPDHWLFRHRWGKGKKRKPDGASVTIKWTTVGGRTSAYVPELQQLPSNLTNQTPEGGDNTAGLPAADGDAYDRVGRRRKRKNNGNAT
ncbi:hypothetical protein AX15_003055 [Amanita polypyramis BW_CC]|nr:hypothetical protein AX15_003055 [Amanita polypyramis BW_CC]